MASEYKNASDCNQNNVSSESDRNDSIICVEDSGENQMEVEHRHRHRNFILRRILYNM